MPLSEVKSRLAGLVEAIDDAARQDNIRVAFSVVSDPSGRTSVGVFHAWQLTATQQSSEVVEAVQLE